MKKIKVGMISYDHIHADMRTKALMESEDVEIVAIAEADRTRGLALQKKYGGDYYEDYRELLKREDIDFVFIHSANYAHKQMVLDAAAAGKDLFCEKPLATSLDDAKEMLEAVTKAGVKHTIGFNSRLIPEAERAKEIIDSGILGKIVSVRAFLGSVGPKEIGCPDYMVDWIVDPVKAGGGALIDEGVHAIDLLRWYLGDISSVYTMTSKEVKTHLAVEDNAVSLFKFANGTLGELNTSWSINVDVGMRNTLEFYGSEGTLFVELTSKAPKVALYAEQASKNSRFGGWLEPQIKPDSAEPHDYLSWPTHAQHFKREIMDIIRRLKENVPFAVTLEDGVKVAEVVSAAYASASQEKRITLSNYHA